METQPQSATRAEAGFDPQQYEDIAPGYYDKVFRRGGGVQWFWHYERYAAVVGFLPPSGRTLLDLGCGPGTFLGNYASGYDEVVGVDLARPQIEYAKVTYRDPRVRFEATDAVGFKGKQQFDAIVSIEVIEHLPPAETQSFLRTIYDLLEPGGTVVLATPNFSSLWPLIEWAVSKKGPVDYLTQHINRFTVARLAAELATAGFEVQGKRTIFLISPFMAFLSASLARGVYRLEQQLLPWRGSEIIMSAKRPG